MKRSYVYKAILVVIMVLIVFAFSNSPVNFLFPSLYVTLQHELLQDELIGEAKIDDMAWTQNNELATTSRSKVSIWNPNDGSLIRSFAIGDITNEHMDIDLNSGKIAITTRSDLHTVDNLLTGESQEFRCQEQEPAYWQRPMGIRPIWSSDGQKIACQAANGIRIWDVKNRTLLFSYFSTDSPEEDLPLSIAWSPDGGQIAYLTSSGHIVVQPVSMMMSDNVTIARNPISWSNHGNSIAYINNFDELVLFDVTQNNETIVFTEFPAPVRYLKWREDDQQVALIVGALSAFEGIDRAYVFDTHLMKLIYILEADTRTREISPDIQWSQHNSQIAFVSNEMIFGLNEYGDLPDSSAWFHNADDGMLVERKYFRDGGGRYDTIRWNLSGR